MHPTLPLLATADFPPIRRAALDTLQANPGDKCNQSCPHCHVAANIDRQRGDGVFDRSIAGQGSSCGGALEAAAPAH